MAEARTYHEMLSSGISRHQLSALKRSGWGRPFRGVYVPPDVDAHIDAALTSVRAPVVVSHLSAAALHGIEGVDGIRGFWRPPPARVDLTVPRGRGVLQRAGVRIRRVDFTERDVVLCDEWPVTSITRTLIDLCLELPTVPAVVMLDSALKQGMIDVDTVAEMHELVVHRKRMHHARRAFRRCRMGAESPFESVSRLRFEDFGLVPLTLQHEVRLDSRVMRADMGFGYDRVTVLGEADGRAFHEGNRVDDYRREKVLRLQGFEIVRWDFDDLLSDAPGLVATIRSFMDRAERR